MTVILFFFYFIYKSFGYLILIISLMFLRRFDLMHAQNDYLCALSSKASQSLNF